MTDADASSAPGHIPIHPPAKRPRAAGATATAATRSERPVGYAALLARYGIDDYRPPHLSYLHAKAYGERASTVIDHGQVTREIFPGRTAVGESDADHLAFAMRYDGIDLEAIRRILPRIEPAGLSAAIAATPTSQYLRRAWYLYEWMMGTELPVAGIESQRQAVVPLLDPDQQITRDQGVSRRHGIRVNCLGTAAWCPQIRRTAAVDEALSDAPLALRDRIRGEITSEEARRINQFLITEETWASFAIEGERPTADRSQRFYDMLERATARPTLELNGETLSAMQRDLMEHPTFKDGNYYGEQVWVGHREAHSGGFRAKVSYIAPRWEDVPALMEQFLPVANGIVAATAQGRLHPIAAAAAVSSGFVYIHPYADGNGRLSRLLMQHAIAAGDAQQERRLLIPLSAAIERDRQQYYDTLNIVSQRIMRGLSYQVDERGQVVVSGSTIDRYRYPDLTAMTAYLGAKARLAVERDVVEERRVLAIFDQAQPELQRISQLPGKDIDLFFRMCKQNHWALSARKRPRFAALSDEQVAAMEKAVRTAAESIG